MTESASRNGPAAWAEANSSFVRNVLGMIRRMAVTLTNGSRWQVLGHTLLDGRPEVHEPENFAGVGIAARPKSPSQCDALLVFPGGASVPVIVGLRDEATRAKVAGDLEADETQLHNSETIVRIKADGTVEIRGATGLAIPLATKADVDALATFLQAMTLPVSGSTAGPAVPGSVPSAVGTSKLKAQ